MTVGGLTCRNNTPDPQTPTQARDNLAGILESLGGNAQCVRKAQTIASESATSGGAHGQMSALGGLFGSASVSANFQTSMASMDDRMSESGCGALMVNAKSIFDSMRRISCTLQKSSVEASVATRASARVNIDGRPSAAWLKTQQNAHAKSAKLVSQALALNANAPADMRLSYESVFQLMVGAGADPTSAMAAAEKASQRVATFAKNALRAARDTFALTLKNTQSEVNITNSNIRVKAGVKVRSIVSSSTQIASEVSTDVKSISQAAAEQVISQTNGKNALTPEVKSVIEQRIQKQQDDINQEITETVVSNKVEVNASGVVTIRGPNIKLSNTEVSAETELDIVTSAVTETGLQVGRRIAQEWIMENGSTQTQTTENAGAEDVKAAQWEGATSAIEAQGNSLEEMARIGAGSGMSSILMLVVVGGVAMAFLNKGGGKGGGKGGKDGPSGLYETTLSKLTDPTTRMAVWAGFLCLKLAILYYGGKALYDAVRQLPNPFDLLKGDFAAFFGALNPMTIVERVLDPLLRFAISYMCMCVYCGGFHPAQVFACALTSWPSMPPRVSVATMKRLPAQAAQQVAERVTTAVNGGN